MDYCHLLHQLIHPNREAYSVLVIKKLFDLLKNKIEKRMLPLSIYVEGYVALKL